MNKEVILLAKGELGIKIAKWFKDNPDYTLKYIVPVIPEPNWTDSISDWAENNDIAIIKSGHYKDIPDVEKSDWKMDLVLSVFYDKIIKKWFIDKCKKILNHHNSPLPKYRGMAPINWALKNNEQHHGITIHEVEEGIDCGPIIAQLTYSIYPEFDEVIDVYKRSLKYGYILFEQTIPILDKIKPIMQNEQEATYYNSDDMKKLGDRSDFTRKLSVVGTD